MTIELVGSHHIGLSTTSSLSRIHLKDDGRAREGTLDDSAFVKPDFDAAFTDVLGLELPRIRTRLEARIAGDVDEAIAAQQASDLEGIGVGDEVESGSATGSARLGSLKRERDGEEWKAKHCPLLRFLPFWVWVIADC